MCKQWWNIQRGKWTKNTSSSLFCSTNFAPKCNCSSWLHAIGADVPEEVSVPLGGGPRSSIQGCTINRIKSKLYIITRWPFKVIHQCPDKVAPHICTISVRQKYVNWSAILAKILSTKESMHQEKHEIMNLFCTRGDMICLNAFIPCPKDERQKGKACRL